MNEYYCKMSDLDGGDVIEKSLKEFFNGERPIVACVGTDATIGDSLGPFVGTMLTEKRAEAIIYGTLENPLTAKEISAAKKFISTVHPLSPLLVIDAAVGKSEDVGLIKILNGAIRPGLGANKDLPEMGSVSIIGIVSEKSLANYAFLNLTRLSPVYRMARIVADGVMRYLKSA